MLMLAFLIGIPLVALVALMIFAAHQTNKVLPERKKRTEENETENQAMVI